MIQLHADSVTWPLLKNLDLSGNDFNTPIPIRLYGLGKLQHLFLSSNDLQGVVSSAIGNLTSIVSLDLSFNALEGKVPSAMGNLCNLGSISLGGNRFGGKVSDAFKSLSGCKPNRLQVTAIGWEFIHGWTHRSNWKVVEFGRHNFFSGPIPMSLRKLSLLELLYLYGNKLNGSLPKWLGYLSNLQKLDISYVGILSEVHFANLTNLNDLNASQNSLCRSKSPLSSYIYRIKIMELGSPISNVA